MSANLYCVPGILLCPRNSGGVPGILVSPEFRQNLAIPLQVAGYGDVTVRVRFDGEAVPGGRWRGGVRLRRLFSRPCEICTYLKAVVPCNG